MNIYEVQVNYDTGLGEEEERRWFTTQKLAHAYAEKARLEYADNRPVVMVYIIWVEEENDNEPVC